MFDFIDMDAEFCQTPDIALGKEWLVSNGLGGYSSSTITGCNNRKHHGLLVSAFKPPTGRKLILSDMIEIAEIADKKYPLSSFFNPDGAIQPEGYRYQVNFRLSPFPVFVYSFADFELEKRVFICHQRNTVVVRYRVTSGKESFRLRVIPRVSCRFINHVFSERPNFPDLSEIRISEDEICFEPPSSCGFTLNLFSNVQKAEKVEEDNVDCIKYPFEESVGYDPIDHVMRLCEMEFDLAMGKSAHVIATLEKNENRDPDFLEQKERRRYRKYVSSAIEIHPEKKTDPVLTTLVTTADSFIVKRGKGKSVIAGYPWFGDWGRDTMIAFPGLLLLTGRFEEARSLLLAFLEHYQDGLIPNMFPEEGETPVYNTVDASLWFINAVYHYYQHSGDLDTVRMPLYEAVRDIIRHYIGGARFGIRQDNDYLITSGEEGWQLTWMDAKVDGIVVTPRQGKNVEINALWYNALKIAAFLADALDDEDSYTAFEMHASQIKESFESEFWFEEHRYLFDTLKPEGPDSSVRPNQVFALSLPFPVIEGEMAQGVLHCVKTYLLTPYGLRSLAPGYSEYKPVYGGDLRTRDFAYHQGTVWSWLMGPYIDALLYAKGENESTVREGLRTLQPLIEHLQDAGLGSVSEIFDGDPPHNPKGCFSQAWSVAELLRVYVKLLALSKGE